MVRNYAEHRASGRGWTINLDVGCVASFLILVEEANYGRAAERLRVSGPALTKRIQRLERFKRRVEK
jgi:hypothetical protein